MSISLSLGCNAGASINDLLTMRSGTVPCQAVWRLRNSTGIVSKAAEAVPAKSISLLKYVAKQKLYQMQWVSDTLGTCFCRLPHADSLMSVCMQLCKFTCSV